MSLEPLQFSVFLGLALLVAGVCTVEVLRFRPDRPLLHRDVLALRRARYIGAGALLFALTISCLGMPTAHGIAWDTGWWLRWEQSPSDWVLMAEVSVVVFAGVVSWCVLPDVRWFTERRNVRRYQAKAVADEKYLREQQLLSIPGTAQPARVDKLVRTFPDTWRTGQWEAVRRIHAGEVLDVPRTPPGRRRLLRKLARWRSDQEDLGNHHFWVPTWHGTARHEAGHAVINASFGSRLLHVYVMREGRGETVHAPRSLQPDEEMIPYHQRWLERRWERMVTLFGGILMDQQNGGRGFQEDGSLSDVEKAMRSAHDLYVRGALLDGAVPVDGVAGWISAGYAEATEILAVTTAAQEQIVAALQAKREEDRSVLGVYELDLILANVPRRPNRVSAGDRNHH